MDGPGELFGQSFDAVFRRPRTVLVPFLVDVAVLFIGAFVFLAVAGVSILFPQGYRLPSLPVAVPHALPGVGDVIGPTPSLHLFPRDVIFAAAAFILLLTPLLAFAEAGFLGVLRAVYLRPADVLEEGRHPDAWSRIREAFVASGKKNFRPFMVLRAIQAALALAALVLPVLLPAFPNYGLAVVAVDVLLLYAPYAVIETGRGAFASMRESVQLVADHLATTLVALLFGLLLTGGMSILLGPVVRVVGPYGPYVASALYAPVGTVLSLYLYTVYLSFYPKDIAPQSTPAPVAAMA
ncbi:MAG: hypothetical protein WDA16_09665 [Candidatus Thermoplasmatota archaeon]